MLFPNFTYACIRTKTFPVILNFDVPYEIDIGPYVSTKMNHRCKSLHENRFV